jgi:hypothetical protein
MEKRKEMKEKALAWKLDNRLKMIEEQLDRSVITQEEYEEEKKKWRMDLKNADSPKNVLLENHSIVLSAIIVVIIFMWKLELLIGKEQATSVLYAVIDGLHQD